MMVHDGHLRDATSRRWPSCFGIHSYFLLLLAVAAFRKTGLCVPVVHSSVFCFVLYILGLLHNLRLVIPEFLALHKYPGSRFKNPWFRLPDSEYGINPRRGVKKDLLMLHDVREDDYRAIRFYVLFKT